MDEPGTDIAPVEEGKPDRWGRDETGLTVKQRLFVEEYVLDFNATQACIRAGYSPGAAKDQGYENLRKPKIVDAITRIMAKRSEDANLDRRWVLASLAKEHRDLDGDKTIAGRRDRIKIVELIGKHVDVAAFRTQLGFAGPNGEPIGFKWNLAALTDEELDEFERLLAKISVPGGDPGREGSADQGEGPGADQAGP